MSLQRELATTGWTSEDAVRVGTAAPAGAISMYGGSAAPMGWLLCDGTAVSRATYADLFAVIGVAFGAGDSSTTFNLPDLRQRFPLGKAASGTGSTLGGTGGAIDHTHTGPSHTHDMQSHTHAGPSHAHAIDATTSYAEIALDSNTIFEGRNNSVSSWTGDAKCAVTTAADGTSHTRGAIVHGGTAAGGTGATGGPSNNTTTSAGTDATGANNPPFQAVNFIIKT